MTTIPSVFAKDEELSAGEAPAHSGVFIGLFAAAGLAFATAQPGLATMAVFAGFASAMAAGMALIAAHDDAESAHHQSLRAIVRFVAPVLMAALLWIAILSTQAVLGAGALATAVALPAFLALMLAESLAAFGMQFGLSRLAGQDFGAPVALLIADKYAGFAGELR